MIALCPRHVVRSALGFVAASVIALTINTARADDPPRPWLAQAPTVAPGAAPATATATAPPTIPWRASLLVGVSAALGAAAVWVRSRKGGVAKLTSSRELRVISTVRVGPKGHLVLAGIGDRTLLLGVTDHSVRRIAWLATDRVAAGTTNVMNAPGALYAPGGASAAIVPANAMGESVKPSGPAPSSAAPSAGVVGKGAFADIMRRLGGRQTDAAPAKAKDTSPAATLAELRLDTVQWSKTAAGAASSPTRRTGANRSEDGAELEQQAAGILKQRSRRRV